MSGQHTAGPWKADQDLSGRWRVWDAQDLTQLLSDADWRSEANARLMAAAPELLEACEALLRFNEELCADVGVSRHYPSAEKARAALAKAQREGA